MCAFVRGQASEAPSVRVLAVKGLPQASAARHRMPCKRQRTAWLHVLLCTPAEQVDGALDLAGRVDALQRDVDTKLNEAKVRRGRQRGKAA